MSENDSKITDQQVIDYLRRHPDFFIQRSDLLSRLNLHGAPKTSSKTTSLGQRQISILREKITTLEQQLQQLASVASANEKLLTRWHDLTLGLFTASSVQGFFDLLEQQLRQDFNADAAHVVLINEQNLDKDLLSIQHIHTAQAGEAKLLTELTELKTPHCGRLTQAKNALLFKHKYKIASAAIVPLEGYGVLAIGSHDEQRFEPGMGVMFLELLGKTITWRLQQHVLSIRKRA